MSRRFALLVNPAAAGGRARAAVPPVRAELERLGAEYHVVETRGTDHARAEATRAAAAGETVIALGGDGLVGSLADALSGTAGALALVPGGRGNDFARVLGIPADPRAAARVAVEGAERAVDVGEVDGKVFVGIASVGFDSDVQEIANATRRVRGGLVYPYAALVALWGWRHAGFEAIVDGRRERVNGYSVAVANSGVYGGGMRLLPDAELDDGRLDVLLIERHSKLRFLRGLPRIFKGTHLPNPCARVARAEAVEISADRPFAIYADGEVIGELPATVRVRPGALRVVAPPA